MWAVSPHFEHLSLFWCVLLASKSFLWWLLSLVTFTAMLLVIWLFRLHRWLLFLIFPCWQLCALVPEKIDQCSLRITCNLLYVACSGFGTLHSFGKLAHSACGRFIQIYTSITDGSWYKLLISQEKSENVSVENLGSFRGYLARLTCACTALYHSSMLWLPCRKLLRRSKWACTSFDWGLQILQIFPRLCLMLIHLMASSRTPIGPFQNLLTKQSLSCISGTQVMLQAHIPRYFPISSTILEIYDEAHH